MLKAPLVAQHRGARVDLRFAHLAVGDDDEMTVKIRVADVQRNLCRLGAAIAASSAIQLLQLFVCDHTMLNVPVQELGLFPRQRRNNALRLVLIEDTVELFVVEPEAS
jgi:hypothetical protein